MLVEVSRHYIKISLQKHLGNKASVEEVRAFSGIVILASLFRGRWVTGVCLGRRKAVKITFCQLD